MENRITPFIKWIGGKRQLITEIENRMPKKFNNFFEPFVGGGALTFHLQKQNTTINDISKELIESYLCIKENPNKLMKLLDIHQINHQNNPKIYFYKMRGLDRDKLWLKKDKFTKSSRFIYLNKTCFNGMYRVNSSGYFNVPWNKKEKINLYDRLNILKISSFLSGGIKILNTDFESAIKNAKKYDFIFFDPPYDLLNKNSFDSYNKISFGEEGQRRLSEIAHRLSEKGCFVMLTNHDTKLVNDLYHDFKIDVVKVKRLINSDAKNRTGIETIIYNY